ncbi:MAG: hypothetical protein GKR89_35395 [Candidatus Latescibacteria bacterium]|nr:hypothetical protein [Candidatus Latescibacterota bacterium]
MPHILLVILSLSLCLCLASSALAHVGGQFYPVWELADIDLPNLHDGSLDDWDAVLPSVSLDHNDFVPLNVADGAAVNPGDLAYRVFLAWSASQQRIYMAIERIDDIYINTYDGTGIQDLWRHDNVEFLLDGDHSGGIYSGFGLVQEDPLGEEEQGPEESAYSEEELKFLNNAQAQQYMMIADAPDGQLLWSFNAGQSWVSQPPYGDAGGFIFDSVPHISGVELYITPWTLLNWEGPELSQPTSLEAGQVIGFQIAIPDFDQEPGQYHSWHSIDGQPNLWWDTDNFVDGELIPCAEGTCGEITAESAVRADSWGWIKASFR